MRAGGVLEVDTEDDEIDYEQLIRAARRAPNLPFGKQLRIRAVGPCGSDRSEIYLDEDFSVQIATRPVPVPQRVAAYHPAVTAYRADADRHGVSGKRSVGPAGSCRPSRLMRRGAATGSPALAGTSRSSTQNSAGR